MSQKYYNASLRNLVYRLRKFKDILERELPSIILELEPVILSMITENQLYEKGVNQKNIELSSYAPYRPSTIQRKLKKGQPVDRVTLRDTGKFYRSLFLVLDSGGFYVDSNDPKAQKLLAKYKPEILGLTNANFSRLLREFIRPRLLERLKANIQ